MKKVGKFYVQVQLTFYWQNSDPGLICNISLNISFLMLQFKNFNHLHEERGKDLFYQLGT